MNTPNIIRSLPLLLFPALLAWGWGNKVDMAKLTYIGGPFSEAKAKYSSAIRPNQCQQEYVQGCQSKFKSQCACFEALLARDQIRARSLYFTVSGETVVGFSDTRNAIMSEIPRFYPPLESYTGDDKPDETWEGDTGEGFRVFTMAWRRGDLTTRAIVWCPLTRFGGQLEMKTPLRKCYTKAFFGSNVLPLKPADVWKKVSVEY